MRIEVSRSGGLLGVTRRGVLDVHGPADVRAWSALAQRNAPGDAGAAPDGYSWRIEVDSHLAVLPDREFDGPLREQAERALGESRPRRTQ